MSWHRGPRSFSFPLHSSDNIFQKIKQSSWVWSISLVLWTTRCLRSSHQGATPREVATDVFTLIRKLNTIAVSPKKDNAPINLVYGIHMITFRYLNMYVPTQKLPQIFLYMSTKCCESFTSFGQLGKKIFY